MAGERFSEAYLSELYDILNPWGPSDDFYLDLVMSASAVLDVGCGTGALLHRARQTGHAGRLCGLDPAPEMLDRARQRVADIEWVLGDLPSAGFSEEFDLVVMTGHAFQFILDDDGITVTLAAARDALVEGGRLAFEIRNPAARAWESWTPDNGVEVTDATGAVVRVEHQVAAVDGDIVRMTETTRSLTWDRLHIGRAGLRFLGVQALSRFLSEAGLVVESQLGDWDGSPLTDVSPEIITITRRC